jgi:hypothetical protein
MVPVDDLVLVSVDAHLIEPPDLFVNHLAPREEATVGALRRRAEGHDVSVMSRSTRHRTADEKLEGFRARARRAVAAAGA